MDAARARARGGGAALARARPVSSSSVAAQAGKQQRQGGKQQRSLAAAEQQNNQITDRIPEPPVTAPEAAGYSIFIAAGLGMAGYAAYSVGSELLITPKHQRVFDEALEIVRKDRNVQSRLGSPLKGFGADSRNRSARQQIPHKLYKDEAGLEHVYVEFQVSGPGGQARVSADKRNDSDDFSFLYVDLPVGGARSRRAQRVQLRP